MLLLFAPPCFARCLLSLLGTKMWSLICLFPPSYGNGEHGEQNEETCCCGCDACVDVCGARSDCIHEQAARGVSEGFSGAVAQKSDGEYASQESVGHALLQDGVGRDVVDAGGCALHR